MPDTPGGSAKRRRKIRWKRVAIATVAAVVVLALVIGAGFYLWFRSQVGAANARVSPDVIAALNETTTTATPTTEQTTTTTLPSSDTSTSVASTSSSLAPTTTSAPETTTSTMEAPSGANFVILGSDTRASSGLGGRSDTIIIVHVDPDKNFVSMLSVPRDLRVTIPGHGIGKINGAYTLGGPALVIRTVKSVFGIQVNHYMEVDFQAFKAITDTLGGVYVDVDRSYDDGKIVFDPGYQLLDGTNALRYVRHRHDSYYDFGRMERQQRFLNAVREQAMGWNLPLKLPGIIKGLFSNIDTDVSANEFLKLAYWGVKLEGGRIRQAKLEGAVSTISGASYVVASDAAIKQAAKDLRTEPEAVTEEEVTPPASAPLAAAALSGVTVDVINGTGRPGQGALAAVWLMRQGAEVRSVSETEGPAEGGAVVGYPSSKAAEAQKVAASLGTATAQEGGRSGRIQVTLGTDWGITGDQIPAATATTISAGGIADAGKWSGLAKKVTFPLLAPTFIPDNYRYSFQRAYTIKSGGKEPNITRLGYHFANKDGYLGFSATTWKDAPIASPGRKVLGPGGVIFRLVGSATKTDHIWWEQGGVIYWVSNTLVYDLQREELLTVALSCLPAPASN